jgi:hypothetical protein
MRLEITANAVATRGPEPSAAELARVLGEELCGHELHTSVDQPGGGFVGGRVTITNLSVKKIDVQAAAAESIEGQR